MLKTHVMEMNTENANCFVYTTDELVIELLGGVRVEGLDRMRVTMKVSVVNRNPPPQCCWSKPIIHKRISGFSYQAQFRFVQ
jgi:hypothetical protein